MLLIAGHSERRAHGAGIGTPAPPHSYTPVGRVLQREALIAEVERRLVYRVVRPVRSVLEVGIERERVDQLARVHPLLRVPKRLVFLERTHQLWAEHLAPQLRAPLPVTVLTGQRTAQFDADVRSFVDVGAVGLDAFQRTEVEAAAGVHASIAKVAVPRAGVAEFLPQLADPARVFAEPLWWYGGIFPAFDVGRLARGPRGRSEAGLAHGPHRLLFGGSAADLDTRVTRRGTYGVLDERLDFVLTECTEFRQHPSAALGQPGERFHVHIAHAHIAGEYVVDTLDTNDTWELPELRRKVGRGEDIFVAEHEQPAVRRPLHQLQRRLGDRDKGGLAADQRARDVGSALLE